jgi:hypothetical protein
MDKGIYYVSNDVNRDCINLIIKINHWIDGFMLNPGLSALWQEETDRRKLLEITKPLDTPDLEGLLIT